MKDKNSKRKLRKSIGIDRSIFSVWNFVIFFILVAFVVTCSFLLFFAGADVPDQIFKDRAKITFLNVIFLSGIFTLMDVFRRKYTIERPMKRILQTTRRITEGDLKARIEPIHKDGSSNEFDVIIESINTMAEELGGIDTLRNDFIANVSHEMKTPLAIIGNYATMLQDPDLEPEKRIQYAKSLTEASRRLSELITNILKLNKLENQQIYPDREEFNLSDQICEALLNFEDAWEEKDINIDTDIEDDVYVNSSRELLSIVWNNLMSNAIKFTEAGGIVKVSLKVENGKAIVAVSDTGCGISHEDGKQIFEKFYQGDTSHSVQGNGLGLALVKRIVDITGSDIAVESEIGKGSTFTVVLRSLVDR